MVVCWETVLVVSCTNVVGAVLIQLFILFGTLCTRWRLGILLCKRRDSDIQVMSNLTAGQTSQRLLTSYTCTNWSNAQVGYIQWKIYSFLFYYFFLLGSLDSNTIKQTKCWQIYNICTGDAYIDLNEICQLTVNVYGTCSRNRQLFDNLTSFYTDMIFHLLWFYFIVKFLLWIVVAVNFYPMHAFLGKPYYWQEFKIKPWKLFKRIWVICDDIIVCFHFIAFAKEMK